MLLQQRDKLVLEASLLVVLGLVFDVMNHRLGIGRADTEGAVAFLPGEIPGPPMLVHPLRRIGLDRLDGLGERQHGRQVQKHVEMVFDPTHGEHMHPVVLCDARDVFP